MEAIYFLLLLTVSPRQLDPQTRLSVTKFLSFQPVPVFTLSSNHCLFEIWEIGSLASKDYVDGFDIRIYKLVLV
jgi:hypothetical protein